MMIILKKSKLVLIFLITVISLLLCNSSLSFSSHNLTLTTPSVISEWNIVSQFDRHYLQDIAASYTPSKNGAVSHNQNGYISVAFQRYSSERTIYGILTKNIKLLEDIIKTFEYAFAHQNTDGSFIYKNPNALSRPKPINIASSVAGFYSDFGHCLLLLQGSDWFQKNEKTINLRKRLYKLMGPTNTSLTWLIKQESILREYDYKTTNLLFLDASAYYFVGKVLNHSESIKIAEKFIYLALQQQMKPGFFLEKGGYDSSYQSVSLKLALLIYMNLNSNDKILQAELWKAIEKGIAWLQTRISPSGKVLTEGNSRVYSGGERYFGKEKGVDYSQVILALNYYSKLSHDPKVQQTADKIFNFRRHYRDKI